ncbi:MBL fold metallo-hydrolase [Streptomyces sp. CA-100214]
MGIDITIGEVRVRSVIESLNSPAASRILPAATAESVLSQADWLAPNYIDEAGNLQIAIQSFLVDADGLKIVIDTCMSPNVRKSTPPGGPGDVYFGNLERADFAREQVDRVICTHLHCDHVGWNTMPDRDTFVPSFPNARYIFVDHEVKAYFALPAEKAVTFGLPTTIQPVLDAGLADLVPADHVISDSIRLVSTPGHTQGHVSVLIESKGQSAFITGDMTHHPSQWTEPGWANRTDFDQAESTATRRTILDRYTGTDTIVIGTHYPPPSAGRLVQVNGQHRFLGLASA